MSKFYEIISSESIMNKMRLLCLVMAIPFTCGVKAQFYDSADDIIFYKLNRVYSRQVFTFMNYNTRPFSWDRSLGELQVVNILDDNKEASVYIWNFDGHKATRLRDGYSVNIAKEKLLKSSSFYEDLVETQDYDWTYSSASYVERIKNDNNPLNDWMVSYLPSHGTVYEKGSHTIDMVIFSSDRNKMYRCDHEVVAEYLYEYKRVDKSFFKVGRSRTPSGKLHE